MPRCDVCDHPRPSQLVPYRDTDDCRVHHFCTVCLDAMLLYFPLHPTQLLVREQTGVWDARRRRRRVPNTPLHKE